jgi:hypothetical protein
VNDKPIRLSSLSQLDGRTAAAKEARDLAAAIKRDVGGDPSAAQSVLIEQGACLSALASDYGMRFLSGQLDPAEIPSWLSTINTVRRVFDTIGTERRSKDISLGDYPAARKATQRAPDSDGEPS